MKRLLVATLLPLLRWISAAVALPFLTTAAVSSRRRRVSEPRLGWGPVPIINNRYWSEAMRRAGYDSTTLMHGFYGRINRRDDFDLYFEDLSPFQRGRLRALWVGLVGPYQAFGHALRQFDVVHHPFSGGFLAGTLLERLEGTLLRLAGVRVVIIPYGFDAYPYSEVRDLSLRHGLLRSYPEAARAEPEIRRRMDYWTRHADAIIPGCMTDGMGRWDVLVPSSLVIDTEAWQPRTERSRHDGRTGPVRVIHTPNHRGFKGTEFLQEAVRQLRNEGLQIDLILVEGLQNSEVRRLMQDGADILAEQFIFPGGYAMSGIEGMASGLPVLANLEETDYTRVFRRYSFLGECPIVSTPPERLVDNLRMLVQDPELRVRLGRAGRTYVEKYHSYRTAQYLFGSVYRWFQGEAIDPLTLFHPLLSSYGRDDTTPTVDARPPSDAADRMAAGARPEPVGPGKGGDDGRTEDRD